jgi:hypothetical protein
MTTLVIGKEESFSGEVPRLPADRLPSGGAARAVNCDFAHGELRSLAGLGGSIPAQEAAQPVRSVFTPDGDNFFAWNVPTRAYLWPTIDDTYQRIIYQPEGEGIWVTQKHYLMSSDLGPPSVAHRIGVPTPILESVITTFIGFEGYDDATVSIQFLLKNGEQVLLDMEVALTEVALWQVYDAKLSSLEYVNFISVVSDPELWFTVTPFWQSSGGLWLAYPGGVNILLHNFDVSTLGRVRGIGHLYTSSKEYPYRAGSTSTYAPGYPAPATGGFKLYAVINDAPNPPYMYSSSTFNNVWNWIKTNRPQNIETNYLAQWFRMRVSSASYGGTLWEAEKLISPNAPRAASVTYRFVSGAISGSTVIGNNVYVAVAVNAFNEEGVPTEPLSVAVRAGEQFSVTARVDNGGDYVPVEKIAFYRASGESGQYFLVAEVPVDADGLVSWVDTVDEPTGTILSSATWDLPPEGAGNLTYVNNGFFCVSSGKELVFSEPYRPHAWPYRMLFPYDVVGVVAIESGLLVTTTSQTWLVMGSHPSEMSQQLLPSEQQGWSSTAMARVLGAAVFASNDGLVTTFGGQPSLNESQQLFARQDWMRFMGWRKAFLRMAAHDGMLLGVADPAYLDNGVEPPGGAVLMAAEDAFLLRLDEAAGMLCRVDAGEPLYGVTVVDGVDTLYVSMATGIAEFGAGAPLDKEWVSRTYVFARPVSFGACVVEGEGPGGFALLRDGEVKFFRAFDGAVHFRLPAIAPSKRWAVRLTGTGTVRSVALGGSFAELQGV